MFRTSPSAHSKTHVSQHKRKDVSIILLFECWIFHMHSSISLYVVHPKRLVELKSVGVKMINHKYLHKTKIYPTFASWSLIKLATLTSTFWKHFYTSSTASALLRHSNWTCINLKTEAISPPKKVQHLHVAHLHYLFTSAETSVSQELYYLLSLLAGACTAITWFLGFELKSIWSWSIKASQPKPAATRRASFRKKSFSRSKPPSDLQQPSTERRNFHTNKIINQEHPHIFATVVLLWKNLVFWTPWSPSYQTYIKFNKTAETPETNQHVANEEHPDLYLPSSNAKCVESCLLDRQSDITQTTSGLQQFSTKQPPPQNSVTNSNCLCILYLWSCVWISSNKQYLITLWSFNFGELNIFKALIWNHIFNTISSVSCANK